MRAVSVGAILAGLALAATGQVQVKVSTGTFLFEIGQKVALELTGDNPCPCTCGTIFVNRFSVLDRDENVTYTDTRGSYPMPAGQWTGRWTLVTADGHPVPLGTYTLLVATSLGEFRAEVRVTAPGGAPLAGWGKAEATVCGIGLRLYRLVEQEDHGTSLSLRVGEHLMVALPGNPTTGFGWEVEGEPAALTRVEGVDYRPSPGPVRIGGGGTFFFRYQAAARGEGKLSFSYRRPWEAGPPARTFSVAVAVRQ